MKKVEEPRKPQTLIEMENLINSFMVLMTNQAYGRDLKFSYKYKWEKGTQKIEDGEGGITKNYYAFTLYLTDKSNSPSGYNVDLYVAYYPITILMTGIKAQEMAYKDFLLNGVQSLVNITYSQYLRQKEQEVVKAKDIKIDEKIEALRKTAERPKLFIP